MYRLKSELIKLLPFGKLRLEVAVHKLKMSFKRLKSCHGKSDISDGKRVSRNRDYVCQLSGCSNPTAENKNRDLGQIMVSLNVKSESVKM